MILSECFFALSEICCYICRLEITSISVMKKLFLLLALLSFVFTACDSGLDNEENGGTPSTPKIELSQQSVEVEFESAEYEVTITSPYSWEATAKNDWIKVITENGIAGTKELKFSVERNEELEIREGTIVVKNEDYNLIAELYITQKAFVPDEMIIEPESLAFAVEGGTQEIVITANFEYEFSTTADWLTIKKSEKGISVTVPNYVEVDKRTAEITISSEKYGISKAITITQQGVSAESKNVIIYISYYGEVVTPNKSDVFGANIVSNTYNNGQGVIVFDAPVTSIGNSAFYECSSLKSVTIPDSVTEIGYRAFYGCSSLTAFHGKFASSDNRCLVVDGVLNSFAPAGLTQYTIPNSVTSIGSSAFAGCDSLTSVTIGNSVTSIGSSAFSGCSSLTSVTIGNSVTSIGNAAFDYCDSLTSVTIPDSVTSIGDGAFAFCSSLTSVTIPDSVTSIGDYAFCGCKSLKSITIPDSVTSIGDYAFCGCSSLTSVTIPDSVTSIGSRAFSGCTSLTSVRIGNSVTSIGSSAFYGCGSLTSVTIGNSVTSIGNAAFDYCSSLTRVDITDLSAWCRIDFSSSYANPLCNGAKLYLNNSEVTELIIPLDVTEIKNYAFCYCDSLTSVTIGNSVTSIGNYAFYDCKSLKSITIPDSVTSIGDKAFYGCGSLTSVTIGNGVTTIGNEAFYNCKSLKSITIPDSVTSIGTYAFGSCDGLTSITIPNSVTSIGNSAFYSCDGLTSITIPNSVTKIGAYAFEGCSSLTSVYCKPTTPPTGESSMFKYNASGRKIYVPRSSVSAYKSAEYWSDYAYNIVGYDF